MSTPIRKLNTTLKFEKSRNDQTKEEKLKQDEWEAERKQDLKEAQEEVHDLIYNTDRPFSYNDIEEILLSYGYEMDGIEEWI